MNQGRKYEKEFAQKIGGKLVPGSGNQWHSKLDVTSNTILWSCKWTSKVSFRITKDILYEAWRAAAGKGGNTIPALSIKIDSIEEEVVVLRLTDFLSLLESDEKIFTPTKQREKILQGRVPKFKRGGQYGSEEIKKESSYN